MPFCNHVLRYTLVANDVTSIVAASAFCFFVVSEFLWRRRGNPNFLALNLFSRYFRLLWLFVTHSAPDEDGG